MEQTKKEILAWKVPKNAEKTVFTDGVIVNIYDTAGRSFGVMKDIGM
ncbi:MAG: hypothetical protein V8Q36_10255 [Anaerotignum sp.]